jgi:hypothetical protein
MEDDDGNIHLRNLSTHHASTEAAPPPPPPPREPLPRMPHPSHMHLARAFRPRRAFRRACPAALHLLPHCARQRPRIFASPGADVAPTSEGRIQPVGSVGHVGQRRVSIDCARLASPQEDALNLLFLGDTNRMIAETPMNLVRNRNTRQTRLQRAQHAGMQHAGMQPRAAGLQRAPNVHCAAYGMQQTTYSTADNMQRTACN